MKNHISLIVLGVAAIALIGAVPYAVASPAHTDVHGYFGTAANTATLHLFVKTPIAKIKERLHAETVVVGACADAKPLVRTLPLIPPTIVRDNDTETGVGGGCFNFKTDVGDDTGTLRTVYVSEQRSPTSPVWITCIDMDGNGFCRAGTSDFIDICTTGTTRSGSVSLDQNVGGTCDVFEDPAAARPTVHVLMIGTFSVTSTPDNQGDVVADTAIAGNILLL